MRFKKKQTNKKNGSEVIRMKINFKNKQGSLAFLTDISIFLPQLYFSSQFPNVVFSSFYRMCMYICMTA